jgi:hypothetical protein
MRLLGTMWQDIKRGENLEFYLAFGASIFVLAFDLLKGGHDLAGTLTLTVLSLLCFVMIRLRHALTQLSTVARGTVNDVLRNDYPSFYREHLGQAQELWIVGMNLRRIFPDYTAELRKVLNRGGTIHAILVTPGSAASHYAAKQDYDNVPVDEYINTIRLALIRLTNLKQLAPDRVSIKVIDHPLSFGLDVVDVESHHGRIYVRSYPLLSPNGDVPILALGPNDSPWYDFYKDQLRVLSEKAVEWVPLSPATKLAGVTERLDTIS